MAKAKKTNIGTKPKTGETWIGTRYLRLMSGRVVCPKTRFVHCGTCLAESLLVKKKFRNTYGYICPDENCIGHKQFDERKSPVPWANQQGTRVALRAWVHAQRNKHSLQLAQHIAQEAVNRRSSASRKQTTVQLAQDMATQSR